MVFELEILRIKTGRLSTLGALLAPEFLCYTLEDGPHELKVPGETRIPAGLYPLELRTFGGFHERYARRFPEIHQGMLWIRDVPQFEDVLVHCGNTPSDTSGCLLLGELPNAAGEAESVLVRSADAYVRVYPLIVQRMRAARASVVRVR